jgi:hypothetical protein
MGRYLGWFRALDRASRSRNQSHPVLRLAFGLGVEGNTA